MSRILLSLTKQSVVTCNSATTSGFLANSRKLSLLANRRQEFISSNSPIKQSFLLQNSFRNFFNETQLKVNVYKFAAGENYERFGDTESFIQRIQTKIDDPACYDQLSADDVVTLLSLCEKEEHLDLLDNLIKIINKRQTGFIMYKWGHGLSRLYFSFNQVDRAYNNLKNVEDFGNIFSGISPYKVIMTLLYNNGRYEQVIELFDQYSHAKLRGSENYIEPVALALAACNMIGSSSTLNKAIEYLKLPEHKLAVSIFVGLNAIKADKPEVALDVISCARSSFTSKELRLKALIKLNRHEDAFFILRSWPNGRYRMHKETYEEISQISESIEDQNFGEMYNDLLLNLKNLNSIRDDEQTLEQSSIYEFLSAYYMFHIKSPDQRRMERQMKQLSEEKRYKKTYIQNQEYNGEKDGEPVQSHGHKELNRKKREYPKRGAMY